MHPRHLRVALLLSAFLAGLAAVFAIILMVSGRDRLTFTSTGASLGGPFRLVDQSGRTVTEADLKGRPHLIFFGFTHCPDVCPTKLFEVSEVLSRLGPEAGKVGAYFVTVDPERDTPEKLKDYLSSFNPRLTGLTGDPAAVAAMAKAYRVYVKKVPLDAGGYTFDHTAIVYLMNKKGEFVAPFNLNRRPEEAADDLRRHL
jgi:protein SCO1/2